MKTVGVSLLALLTGACGGEDADRVFVTASWSFRSIAGGAPLPCPSGFAWVYLHVRARDGGLCNAAQFACPSRFECAAETGTSVALVPGEYDAWLEVRSDDEASVYATSTTGQVDLSLGDRTFARQFLTDGGVFKVAWKLHDDAGAPLSCHAAGVARVAIFATGDDPSSANNDEPACDAGTSYTLPYPVGTYTVMFDPVSESGQSRGIVEPLIGQVIQAPNGITDLGTINILVTQ